MNLDDPRETGGQGHKVYGKSPRTQLTFPWVPEQDGRGLGQAPEPQSYSAEPRFYQVQCYLGSVPASFLVHPLGQGFLSLA